jgi:parvulin-like peptidyl-prolyl isomerase
VNLCVQRLIEKVTGRTPRPKHKEVADYYQKNRAAFYVPELVHAAHIVKNVEPEADEESARAAIAKAESELRNGRSFEEVADECSDCPGRGGDLSFFSRGQMVEEFENVVFALEPGQVSEIFRTPFGFHIAKLYEKKPEDHRPFNEVRGEIEQALHGQKKDEVVGRFVDELRARAEIRKTRAQAKQEAQV